MSLRDKEVAKFDIKLSTLISHHKELQLAIHNKKNEASLGNELVTQLTLSVSVLWESFLHDIMIAYILMDPRRTLLSIEERVLKSIEDKFGDTVAKNVSFGSLPNVTRSKLLSLLAQKGWNITSPSASKLSSKANSLLAAPYAIKFSLDPEDSEFYDYIRALRNYLGHNSDGARKVFKDAISNLSESINLPLKANLNQIDAYLKAPAINNKSRVEYIIDRLKTIANKL